jgi:hypothetical protein
MPATAEQQAIISDAAQRVAELQAVHAVLLPDVGDAAVAVELACIESEIAAAEKALDNEQTTIVAGPEQESEQ